MTRYHLSYDDDGQALYYDDGHYGDEPLLIASRSKATDAQWGLLRKGAGLDRDTVRVEREDLANVLANLATADCRWPRMSRSTPSLRGSWRTTPARAPCSTTTGRTYPTSATSPPWTGCGWSRWTCSLRGFPVRTSATPADGSASEESAVDSGRTSSTPVAYYDPATCSLKSNICYRLHGRRTARRAGRISTARAGT